MEGFLADKSTRLILEALTHAAAEPATLPLFAGKGNPGLFPATASARQAAKRCQDDGLIRLETIEGSGKSGREVCVVTDKGLDWLLSASSPRHVLEDFLRVLEQKQARTAELIAAARQMASGLESLRGAIERLTPRIQSQSAQTHHLTSQSAQKQPADLKVDIAAELEKWHAVTPRDCPLPELFRTLKDHHAEMSVGQFHDALRGMHEEHQVYLHPWTGPLYEIPEPAFAMLAGHEVAYYASPRQSNAPIADLGSRISDGKSASASHSAKSDPSQQQPFNLKSPDSEQGLSEIRNPKSEIRNGSSEIRNSWRES
jgi:hypothetical protein